MEKSYSSHDQWIAFHLEIVMCQLVGQLLTNHQCGAKALTLLEFQAATAMHSLHQWDSKVSVHPWLMLSTRNSFSHAEANGIQLAL